MTIGRIALSSKLPWLPAKRDRVVVADHLDADHHHGLALGRVDLARHDRGARLVRREHQLAESAARARGEPAHVVGDLHQRDRRAPRSAAVAATIASSEP